MARANDLPPPNRRSSIYIEEDDDLHELDYNEFAQQCGANPRALYDRLLKMYQKNTGDLLDCNTRIVEAELKLQSLESDLVLLRCEKGELEQKLDSALADRNVYANQIAKMVVQNVGPVSREATPAPAARKSTKIPDPPMLTDGKEPRFEDWLLLMTQKLAANSDHFDSAQLRMAYVASRCEGKARKHITPRMREDAMSPYHDSKDMLDHLKTIYSDPNRVTAAKHQFRQLYMKTSDKFHDFLSEFLYLAAEAGVAEDDWKDELYHKLTTKLQELCIVESFKKGTFQEFSSAVSQTASRLEVINYRTQRNRPLAPTSKGNAKGINQSGSIIKKEPTPSRSSSPTVPQASSVGRDRLMKEGRCFHCQEHGHLARDCPAKAVTPELKELEQKAPENEMKDETGKV